MQDSILFNKQRCLFLLCAVQTYQQAKAARGLYDRADLVHSLYTRVSRQRNFVMTGLFHLASRAADQHLRQHEAYACQQQRATVTHHAQAMC